MQLSDGLWGCTNFDDYHQLYVAGGDVPNHGKSRWPCIAPGIGEWLVTAGIGFTPMSKLAIPSSPC